MMSALVAALCGFLNERSALTRVNGAVADKNLWTSQLKGFDGNHWSKRYTLSKGYFKL
jgi:hypothetical protein